jgi:CubicO group peptidase (beta-lactamase class C family)
MAQDVMREQHAPGMALCVMSHGRIAALRAYGTADLEHSAPVTNETEFPIASITKQVTATAILLLSQSGHLSLDDDISRFVPDFPARNAGVTIRRLLNHTSGVRNLQDLGDRYWKQSGMPVKPADIIALFKDESLDFPPGIDYRYSNSGYVLLGAAIESASGESYGEFLEKHLFGPLGLTHIFYPRPLQLIPGRARGYWPREGSFVNAAHYDDSQGFSMGGVYSTAEDLARWTEALHHGAILKPETYRLMVNPETLPNGERLSYGYGVEIGEIGHRRTLSHAGGGVGFITQAIYVPQDDLVVVALTNAAGGGGAVEMADQVLRRMLDIPGPVDLPLPAATAARYAGRYRMDSDIVDILREGDHLVVRYSPSDAHRLRYQGNGIFAQDGRVSRLHFRERNGLVKEFVVARYGSLLDRATRID